MTESDMLSGGSLELRGCEPLPPEGGTLRETPAVAARALALLRTMTGDAGAQFRPGQLEAIQAIVEQRGRALVVQRTGWGKSAVYFIATKLLRDRGSGPTLLVSPLLALMRNQLEMAHRVGLHAGSINSQNTEEWPEVEEQVRQGSIDLLLVSPERLNHLDFRENLLPIVVRTTGLVVVDEAHCISDWGHDFRPDYRRIARVLDLLPSTVPVLCTTATANQRVIDDVLQQLGGDLLVFRGPLDRESLRLSVVALPDPAKRLAWLANAIPGMPGSGIVYCLTVRDTEMVAGWLRRCGIEARAYSGETESSQRVGVEEALAANRLKVVVATSALGMGYDKPDLGFVIHYQSPGSPIAYYQQVGRAGRNLAEAEGVLLVGSEDADIQDYFIRTAFPPQAQAESVVALLERTEGPMTLRGILAHVNVRQTRLEAMLKVLEVEGAVERPSPGRWQRTPRVWSYDVDRVERVTAARRQEQMAMRRYVETSSCLMAFLRRELDDPESAPCGRCGSCTGREPDTSLAVEEIALAREWLRSSPLVIEPRKQWVADVAGQSTIPQELRLQEGRSLSNYDDGGWGHIVRDAKYAGGTFSEELVAAAAGLIRQWSPQPAPAWVTSVPSVRQTRLVLDFAERLAGALGLPFHDVVMKVQGNAPQKQMENSPQQLRNVYGAFSVSSELPAGPVLLVDDIHDSRWTLTVVGVALRTSGSGPVYPFTLAQAVSS
ncbi:MAG: ATP-dependent helicase RecQ [Actinomycetota bacterium]|nr:ATP-dependent helicase RecQ [Actinomycetota bacterium]